VSVRLSIANFETVVANALRRTLRTHDSVVVPRGERLKRHGPIDPGKIEFDTMDDSDADQVIAALVSLAVRQCFSDVLLEEAADIVDAFNSEAIVHTGDDLPDANYSKFWPRCRSGAPVERIAGPGASDGERRPRLSLCSKVSTSRSASPKTRRARGLFYRSRNR